MTVILPDKAKLQAGCTGGEFSTAIGQLVDFIGQYLPYNFWGSGKTVAVGNICISPNLPSYAYAECVVAGMTGTTEPTWGVVGQYVNDSTAKWIVRDILDGTPVGRPVVDSILRPGYIKRNGALINRSDYPTLVKYLNDNPSEVTTEANWAANKNLWTLGDGSTTIRVPDDRGLYEQPSDAAGLVAAGLPNIYGSVLIGNVNAQISTVSHSGAFSPIQTYPGLYGGTGGNYSGPGGIVLNAQAYNSIYGNSTTVTPPSVKRIIQMKY